MKKTVALSVLVSIIALSACSKGYVCNCSAENGVYTKETKLNRSALSRKKAKTICASKASAGENCYPVYSN